MDEARIVEIKKKIYTLLDCNGFEKKLNSGEPFTFSYIKHGDSFELKIRFPKDELSVLQWLQLYLSHGLI